jgi:hypothetical protein
VSDTIISFTTIEYPNQEVMDKSYEIFEKEMVLLADKLRPQGIWLHMKIVTKSGKKMVKSFLKSMVK